MEHDVRPLVYYCERMDKDMRLTALVGSLRQCLYRLSGLIKRDQEGY